MATFDVRYTHMSLSVRYASVFFPIDAIKFLSMVREADFLLPDRLEEAMLATGLGARVEVSGVVARKGDVGIRINPDRQVLAVHAPEPRLALSEMEALESLLMEKAGIRSASVALFYEVLADATIRAGASPLESWTSRLGNERLVLQASQLLEAKVAPFGLRLVPAGEIPDQADWFDIRIEPQVLSPMEFHHVNVVFRNSSRETVFGFLRNLDRTIEGLISLVEEGQHE